MSEKWKDVPGHEGAYQVSDCGRVRSLDRWIVRPSGRVFCRGKLLRPVPTARGNLKVTIGTKQYAVHTLVMLAFVGPRPDNMEVCHNDGDKHYNALTNLRYDTHAGNEADKLRHGTVARGDSHGNAKLSAEAVMWIRANYRWGLGPVFAARFGVHQKHINRVVQRSRWGHVA
jgi:hypothetical protein